MTPRRQATAAKTGQRFIVVIFVLLLGGCAGIETRLADERDAHPETRACRDAFAAADAATRAVRDAEAARVPGFPYLRSNRLLAAFAERPLDDAAFATWVDRLRRLEKRARAVEFANLPAAEREKLAATPEAIERCAGILRRHDLKHDKNKSALRRAARVPDSYNRWLQVAGLYPLSLIPVRFGIMSLHEKQRADFKSFAPPEATRTYAPEKPAPYRPDTVRALVTGARRDALGIPVYDDAVREKLLAMFAPRFEIETRSGDDRPGRPMFDAHGRLTVDTRDPVLYRRLAFTRFRGAVLTQLVYTIWFPARTPAGPLDIFAGPLDGLIWRVTLDPKGRPMIYDSIHPCGCYHLFFPVAPRRLNAPERHGFHAEPPLAPIPGPALRQGQRLRLRVQAETHYLAGIEAVRDGTAAARTYRFENENSLRSLPHPRGRKSLYAPDGLVPASERPERFILWPMGVPSAGAMRQWGHHATAFIGTRHFDDADLIERVIAR